MAAGDVLVYADGGCEFTGENIEYLRNLFPFESDLDLKAIVLQAEHSARRWTTRYCAEHIPGASQFLDLPQVCATIIFFRNTPDAQAFANEWLRYCMSSGKD